MRRKKAFTLVEMVIVLVIIFLVLVVFLPANLSETVIQERVQCAAQMSNIGKAIAVYTNEYNGSYPTVASSQNTCWVFCRPVYNSDVSLGSGGLGTIDRWYDPAWSQADWNYVPTIGGCLYLLCKYGDLAPKNFVCPGCEYGRDMNQDIQVAVNADYITSYKDCSDFSSMNCCTYSYQNPVRDNLPTAESDPGLAVFADKNWSCDSGGSSSTTDDGTNIANYLAGTQPYWGIDAATATTVSEFINKAICTEDDSTADFTNQPNNSQNHETLTQNVLFADFHVERCDKPFVGIGNDNIYTRWSYPSNATAISKLKGTWGTPSFTYTVLQSLNKNDTFLGN